MIARLLLLLLLLGGALLAPLAAQTARVVHQEEGREVCFVDAFVSGGSQDGVGLGFARVRIENRDDKAHRFVVDLGTWRRRGDDVRAARALVVEGGGSARFWLPVPHPPRQGRLLVEVDGVSHSAHVAASRNNGLTALFVSDDPDQSSLGLAAAQALPSALRVSTDQVACLSEDLPADWRLFTAFPFVVVDGRADVGGEAQEALRRYAFAGGAVFVLAPERLPAGPLRERATRLDGGVGGHGLGVLLASDDLELRDDGLRARLRDLPPFGERHWPVSRAFFTPQEIEGLGRAPVKVFVLVIVLFAVLVGPVNFMLLRRRKKPMLALLTVPVAGLGTTLAILLYGVVHDGFGLRGALSSWTVIDQVEHEGVAVAARTLFAGLAPDDLTMDADVALLSLRAGLDYDEWTDRWHWDADRQRLDGGVLPSRTPTPLVSVQQGALRERLAVRRVAADALEVVPGGGVEQVGVLALCDLDGNFWLGDGGRLRRVGEREGTLAFAQLLQSAATVEVPAVRRSDPEQMVLPQLLPRGWPVPGSYATMASAAPWLAEHGLSVAYDTARHLVMGRMDEGDFLR